jgi:hypothetical protein
MKNISLAALALLSTLLPLGASAITKQELMDQGIATESITKNIDGSITFVAPMIVYGGNPYWIAKGSNPDSFCKLTQQGKSVAFELGFKGLPIRIIFLGEDADGNAHIKSSELSNRNHFYRIITCKKLEPKPLAAGMEDLLKQLREINGVELRPDGSVVIDSRLVKKLVVVGNDEITIKHERAEDAQ